MEKAKVSKEILCILMKKNIVIFDRNKDAEAYKNGLKRKGIKPDKHSIVTWD